MNVRALVAEALGSALLLVAVVGSGVVVATDPSASAALFRHAVVVGVVLVALVVTFAHVSGAHFNPAVTLASLLAGELDARDAAARAGAQIAGAVAGTVLTNVLFGLPTVALATTVRTGPALALSEAVATFGLVLVIHGVVRSGAGVPVVALAVGGWITGAIVATSSDAFANPAVTLARTLTDSWTGMAPGGVAAFVVAQLAAAALAARLSRWLFLPSDAPPTQQAPVTPVAVATTPDPEAPR